MSNQSRKVKNVKTSKWPQCAESITLRMIAYLLCPLCSLRENKFILQQEKQDKSYLETNQNGNSKN